MSRKTKVSAAWIIGFSTSALVLGTAAKGLESGCSTSATVTDVSNGTGGDPGTFGATGSVTAPPEQVQTFPTDSASIPSDKPLDMVGLMGLIGNVLQWKEKQSVSTIPASGVDWPDQPKPASPDGDCLWLPIENLIETANDDANENAREALDNYINRTISWDQLQNAMADIEREFDAEITRLEQEYPQGWYKFCPNDIRLRARNQWMVERIAGNPDHPNPGPATKTDNHTALCGDTTPPVKDEDLDFRYVPHPPAKPPAKTPPPKPPEPPPKPVRPEAYGDSLGEILRALLGLPGIIPLEPNNGFDPVPPNDDAPEPGEEKRVEIG